ncbi:DUF1372 family protein [Streptococcus sp. E17BB]|uniref:DUF1372 family protein n=1 Tax=Streptococcus sp. E17BB TaxID=3278714 RepID=UPI00359ED7EF
MNNLKDKLFHTNLCLFSFVVGIVLGNIVPLKLPEQKQPVIIYTVDNAGGAMVGKITDKEIIEGRYTVTAGPYGRFLVTKEQYESLTVGAEIPDYLKKRGFSSNE